MGQKLNPTIFRLGVNKIWKTEFFEKKNRELPLYIFKDLEIKKYIERVLETTGIILHDYKQHYNNSTLNLYISYFVTPDFVFEKKKITKKLIIKNTKGEKLFFKKLINDTQLVQYVWNSSKTTNSLSLNSSQAYKIKQYLKLDSPTELFTQTSFSNYRSLIKVQNNRYLNKSLNSSSSQLEGALAQIFTVLNLFLGNQSDIIVNFNCINKNVQFLKHAQKKIFISLQKFRNTPFFKEGIELLFNVTYNINSANLLAKFIAFQLKKIKRHKFFLSFLKQTLTILLTSSLSKIKGVKIMVKGRLNGLPRAKHKIIIIGDVPVQTISVNLDYSQATAHSSNGCCGIKVWVVEK